VSLIWVVLVALATPLTRKATIATMSMQATVRVTTISTSVKPTRGGFAPARSLPPKELSSGFLMGWP
jgi:hypothetical protein